MKNITSILILISCFLLSYCSKETKNNKQSISLIDSTVTMSKKEGYDFSDIGTVCDCYEQALNTLDKALKVRKSYNSFDDFIKDKYSVKKVKDYTNRWRVIQNHCVKTFQRAMFMENDCNYPLDSVHKKREELYALGIKP